MRPYFAARMVSCRAPHLLEIVALGGICTYGSKWAGDMYAHEWEKSKPWYP